MRKCSPKYGVIVGITSTKEGVMIQRSFNPQLLVANMQRRAAAAAEPHRPAGTKLLLRGLLLRRLLHLFDDLMRQVEDAARLLLARRALSCLAVAPGGRGLDRLRLNRLGKVMEVVGAGLTGEAKPLSGVQPDSKSASSSIGSRPLNRKPRPPPGKTTRATHLSAQLSQK